MTGTVSPAALRYALELEAEDGALAGAISELEGLRREADELAVRAAHVDATLSGLPEARSAGAAAVAESERELQRRRDEALQAAADLERAAKEEAVLAARRAVVRTRDTVAGAERRLERLRSELAAVDAAALAAKAELPGLQAAAAGLAERLRALGRVPELGAPIDVGAWAGRAAAALFVARSGLDSERERVIRQANELGASALGEPLVVTSVSLVRERLERAR